MASREIFRQKICEHHLVQKSFLVKIWQILVISEQGFSFGDENFGFWIFFFLAQDDEQTFVL